MKKSYWLLVLAVVASTVMLPEQAKAQASGDTLVVEWAGQQGPIVNALRNAILGDTLANGQRQNVNRVYKLQRGGLYFNTDRIEVDFPLRIVGERAGTEAFDHPPLVQIMNREDGSIDEKMFVAKNHVELRNLYINGKSDLGNFPYEIIRFDGASSEMVVDNVIFEHAWWGIIGVYGANSNLTITNSKFRNMIHHDQKWGGRGLSVWVDMNRIRIEHNTFFNINGFAVQVEGGAPKEMWFNHNTIVNGGREIVLGSWWLNAYFTNNLIVNGFWHAEDEQDFNQARLDQPDLQNSGFFSIETVPSRYGIDGSRKIVYARNASWRDPAFQSYYASTSGAAFPLRPVPMFNQRTLNFIERFETMIQQENIEGVNPGIVQMGNLAPNMIQFIQDLRAGLAEKTLYYYYPNRGENDPVAWPLPENLSYTNAQLLGAAVGGFPMGDLNWFPQQKMQWMAQSAQLEAEIRAIGPAPKRATRIGTMEAEMGTVAGGAAIEQAPDPFIAEMKGSGLIRWTVNVPAAGNYDVTFRTRVPFDTSPDRAQELRVNGNSVGNFAIGNAGNVWTNVGVTGVAFNAGENTIEVRPSWGYQDFESVTVATPTPITRGVGSAVVEGMELRCGGALCASGGSLVRMSSGGSVSWSLTGTASEHALGFTVTAVGEAGSVEVFVNGSSAGVLAVTSVGSWQVVTASGINLRDGANSVEVRSVSGTVLVDAFDLFTLTSVRDRSILPEGFELLQNFPNPFGSATQIGFEVGQPSAVRVVVYDLMGRQVSILQDGFLPAGSHSVVWDGRGASGDAVASGIYFYRLETPFGSLTRRMVLIQ